MAKVWGWRRDCWLLGEPPQKHSSHGRQRCELNQVLRLKSASSCFPSENPMSLDCEYSLIQSLIQLKTYRPLLRRRRICGSFATPTKLVNCEVISSPRETATRSWHWILLLIVDSFLNCQDQRDDCHNQLPTCPPWRLNCVNQQSISRSVIVSSIISTRVSRVNTIVP